MNFIIRKKWKELIIKCQACGVEYSYGRNICHICDGQCIFFGAILKKERIERQWNCVTKRTLASLDKKKIKTSNFKDIDNYELIFEEIRPHEWNCSPLLRTSSQDKGISYLYE